ncbi:phage major capsid protein [Sphingomonas sp. BAUL-RG-20F-R05-02]|uniref:phage major capsid protein n=1 Tax=Sphingomonas sp. BAUL-RG-20F-R05-02 TaxID=2914830 RepID=UPI001F5A0A89|nr:phage major capsid protein [Sphingomonas sp. BAUL-RG-20F-R05-02]
MQKTILLAAVSRAALGPMSATERKRGRYMRDGNGHPARPVTVQALRDRRATAIASMQALIATAEGEDRDLSAEEQGQFDTLQAESTSLGLRIDRAAGLAETAAGLAASTGSVARGNLAVRGPEANKEFESLGQFMSAVRFNPNDQRLNWVEGAETDGGEISAEMRMDNAPSGGFMVPNEFRSTIMSVQPQDALVRPRATVIEPGTAPDAGVSMPALDQGGSTNNMFGGMQFSWIGEGDLKPETDAKLREIALTPHEIAGFVTVTDKLLRNWPAAGSFLENLMRGGVAAAEDYSFLRGDGRNKPMGAMYSSAAKYINRKLAGQITYEDLVGMVGVLLMRGNTSPVWSMSQGVLPQLLLLKDGAGRPIWQDNARDGFAGTLLGYPVRWNNRAPVPGQKGDVFLADWSQYLIKDGSGPFVAASEHVLFTRNKTVIKIFWNVDGMPWLSSPIKEENGYEVSPFVGLDVPA